MAASGCGGPAGWDGVEVASPLGQATSGRLVFAHHVSRLRLRGETALTELYRGRFSWPAPCVRVDGGLVTVQWSPSPPHDEISNPGEPLARFSLNAAIPWEIEFRSGLSQLDADLRSLQLRSLDVLGGASRVQLSLSRPAGTAFIYLEGSVREALLLRPPGVAVRLQARGGLSGVAFDGRRPASAGGEISIESPGFDRATSRYDICLAGGASSLRIEKAGRD